MEIGGLVAQAFKTIFGNPDVMILTLSWASVVAILFTVYQAFEKLGKE